MFEDFTLQYGSTSKSFDAWGMIGPVLTLRSQARSELRVQMPGEDLSANGPFAFEGKIIARWGEDQTPFFQGRAVTNRRNAHASAPSRVITFADPWYDLEVIPFQQLWKHKASTVPAPDPLTDTRFSRYNLFQDYPGGALITNGRQIQDIITYAISCGANLQLGTVEPATLMPIYPARAMMCSEAILMCLKPQPDAVIYFDYTTTPPTFHCRLRQSLTAITMPYAGVIGSAQHKSSDITRRDDLVCSQVVIDYQKDRTITVDGASKTVTSIVTDAYPAGSNGEALRAIVLPVDLRGSTESFLTGTVKSQAFDPTTVAFWKVKKPELASAKVRNLTVLGSFGDTTHPITVKDETNASVDLSIWPYEWTDGTVNPWMIDSDENPIRVIQCTVSADLSWDQYDAPIGGLKRTTHESKRISVRVKLTNSPPPEVAYSIEAAADTGDSAPPNLAQQIFQSHSQRQYEGSHDVLEQGISRIVGPQYVLNLTGGDPEWATMGATIQTTTLDFMNGRTSIAIGPAKHIAPSDLAEMLIWARFRFVWENPAVRTSGQASAAGQNVESAKNLPMENTTDDLPEQSYFSIVSKAKA